MYKDFLVCWTNREYIPNGTEYEGGDFSGQEIFETTFSIMSGDETLRLEDICTVSDFLEPTPLSDESLTPYVVVGTSTAIIALSSSAYTPYATRSLAILDMQGKSINLVIDDLTLAALSLTDLDVSLVDKHRIRYMEAYNNSYTKNGDLQAWFGLSVAEYPSMAYVNYYFAVDVVSGVITRVTDLGGAGNVPVRLMTSNLVSYNAEGIGGWTAPCLFSRVGDTQVPLLQTTRNSEILSVSDDGFRVLTLFRDPEVETFSYGVHDLTVGGSPREEIHFYQGWPDIKLSFIDFGAGVIALGTDDGGAQSDLTYYDFNSNAISSYPKTKLLRYMNPNSSAAFVRQELDSSSGHSSRFAVILSDGSVIRVDEKHPWNTGHSGYPRFACLGMWASSAPNNFWTAFRNTKETV